MKTLNRYQHLILRKIAGVELNLSDGLMIARVAVLERQGIGSGKGVEIAETFDLEGKDERIFQQLKTKLPANCPLAININGTGVLCRQLERRDDHIQQLFPNANPGDLHWQKESGGKTAWMGIARSEIINKRLDQMIQAQLQPIGLSLGPLPLIEYLNQFEHAPVPEPSFGLHNFSMNGMGVEDYRFETPPVHTREQPIDIFGEKIEPEYALPVLTALDSFSGRPVAAEEEQETFPQVEKNRLEYLGRRMLRLTGFFLLGLLLTTLLVNFFLFGELSDRNQQLRQSLAAQTGQLEKLQQLTTDVESKEAFLQSAGWLNASRASYFADRIAASIPRQISLNRLEIYPLVENRRTGDPPSFEHGTIAIAGNTSSSQVFNSWQNELRSLDWTADLTTEHYDQINTKGQSEFSLTIKLNSQ